MKNNATVPQEHLEIVAVITRANDVALQNIINRLRINQVFLAEKMGMPVGTFKNKLNVRQSKYRFTVEEEIRLRDILLQVGLDLVYFVNPDYIVSNTKKANPSEYRHKKALRKIESNTDTWQLIQKNPLTSKGKRSEE